MKWAFLGTLFASVLLFSGVGALHTSAGRPVLRWLAGGGCPVGGPVTAEVREASRRAALGPLLAGAPAVEREVFGLSLGSAGRPDLDQWRAEQGATCREEGEAMRCTGLLGADELLLAFDPSGRVVSIDARAVFSDPSLAAAQVDGRTDALVASLGPAESVQGTPTGEYLAAAPLRQLAQTFAFSDYRVKLTATHANSDRYVVREVHQVP